MDFRKVYDASTTPKTVLDEEEAARLKKQAEKQFEDTLQSVGYKEWLENPVTQRFLAHINLKSNENIQQAEDLAQDTQQNQARTISKCLITSQLLQKVITYAKERRW